MNQDMLEPTEPTEKTKNAVLLISLFENAEDEKIIHKSLDELERLVETSLGDDAEYSEIFRLTQCRRKPDCSTYIGSGKAIEAGEFCVLQNIFLVVVNGELSPSQIRNLENEINSAEHSGTESPNVRVIDRTMLILDIFAKHAVTNEGKLQIEIAQLKYSSPRLTGKGIQLSRQGGGLAGGGIGGIGARGPGETKLETDRRHLKKQILALEGDLKLLESERAVKRSKRTRAGISVAAIAGYTNAGKSTLLNYLTDAGVLSEDKLFATLDPTVRNLKLPSGKEILLSDTVGFISNLPHQLVEAFRSTLDEVKYADMILIVIDAADEDAEEKTKITEEILTSLGATDKMLLYVFNKWDKVDILPPQGIMRDKNAVCISSKTGAGTDALLSMMEEMLNSALTKVKFLFPFDVQNPINVLYKNANVLSVEYAENGTLVEALVDLKIKGQYKDYIVVE